GDFPVLVGKVNLAHGTCAVTGNENGGVFYVTLCPALECEARILGEGGVSAHKVGQCAFRGSAKCLRVHGQRRLEQHHPHLVAIGGINNLFCQGFCRGLSALLVGRTDVDQCLAPALLSHQHFLLGDCLIDNHTFCKPLTGEKGKGCNADNIFEFHSWLLSVSVVGS